MATDQPLGLCCPMCGGKIRRLERWDAENQAWGRIYDFARSHIEQHHDDGSGDWHRPDDHFGGYLAQQFRSELYAACQNLAHAFAAMRVEAWTLHPQAIEGVTAKPEPLEGV